MTRTRIDLVLFFLVALALPGSGRAQSLIVNDGKPNGVIVVAEKPTRTTQLAAEQLQTFVERMSGAALPIQTKPADGEMATIYIGSAAAGVGVTAEGLKYGAYRVRSGGKWLALVGDDTEFVPTEPYRLSKSPSQSKIAADKWHELTGEKFGMPNSQLCTHRGKGLLSDERIWAFDEWGSFNAVVDFLRSLGCRWYVPHEIGEVVPAVKTIALPRVDKTVKPDFPMRYPQQFNRKFGQNGATREEVLWQMRLGLHFGYDILGTNVAHGMTRVFGAYGKEHPEWFALYGGKRETGFRSHGKPCLSSEGLFEANVRYVRKVFDILDLPSVSVMPSDGYVGLCGCPLCKGKGTPKRGWAGQLSDYVWTYVDRVAREAYKTHPEKKITCLAYGSYLLPPQTIEKLSPNLVVGIAQYRIGFNGDRRKQLFRQLRQDWLAKMPEGNKQFWLYEYYRSAGNANPAYFPRLIAEDMRSLKGICLGEFNDMTRSREGIRNMAVDHLNLYVTARCQWDAELDIEALLDDYYAKFYGPAREPMKAFIEHCERHRATMLKDAGQIDAALAHLKNGLAAAPEGTIYRKRIEWIGEYFALLPDLKAQLAKARPDVPVAKARSGWGTWVIDGKNDDGPWRKFPGGYSLRELNTGRAPTFGTTFHIISTDKQLYIWISCADLLDAPLNIQGTKNDSASIWNGDVVEVLLAPPGHSYYQIAINPAGVVTDLDRKSTGLTRFNTLWSSNAEVATDVKNGRWNVEIRIPLAGAGMDDIDPDNGVAGNQPTERVPWYFNICRQRLRKTGTELSAFSPTGGARGFHDADRFGELFVDFRKRVRKY